MGEHRRAVTALFVVAALAAGSALAADTDGDGLQDAVETGTGIFVSTNNWTSGTNNGPITIVHTGATNQPSRFYRIRAESKDATPQPEHCTSNTTFST